MIEKIIPIAKMILTHSQAATVRYRLLRDVFKRQFDDPGLRLAKTALDESVMVQMLAEEQWKDGSWGRVHSQDTKRKQKIKTTEAGVQRAVALGLEHDHPVCAKAAEYLVRVLDGKQDFPDPPEPNDRWSVGEQLFLTATLSLIEPEHPHVKQTRKVWQQILQRTFRGGFYNPEAELDAHCELTGATTMRDSYLVLNNRYSVDLLSSGRDEILPEIERAYLDWLMHLPEGIGYVGIPMDQSPHNRPSNVDRWFKSWELFSHFSHWTEFAQPAIEWLWSQQNDVGLWDFGSRPSGYGFLPLSDSWRTKYCRTFDWSTRVLLLLNAIAE